MSQAVGRAVSDPFPYIAMHVVEAIRVRQKTSSRRCKAKPVATWGDDPVRIGFVRHHVGAITVFANLTLLVPEGIRSVRAAACRIFPLRFGQQAIVGSDARAEPLRVGDRVPPADAGYGMVVVLIEPRCGPRQLRP